MRVGLVGVGRAGGAVVDALTATADRSRVAPVDAAVVIDTDEEHLAALSAVPEANRTLVGQVETAGRGTGGDQEQGVEIAGDATAELRAALDAIPASTDAVFLIAGLAGGTGGGLGPCVGELLSETMTQPLYGVGVLPSDAEDEAGEHAARGMRALRALREPTTDVLLADLDRWRRTDAAVETAYGPADTDLADALWSLVAASETDGSGATPERTLDASEVVNTLQGDGVATLARAENDLPTDESGDDGLLDTVKSVFGDTTPEVDDVTAERLVTTTVREALHTEAFVDDGVAGAARAALVVDAPAPYNLRAGGARPPGECGHEGGAGAARAALVVDAPAHYILREGVERATGIVEDETGSVAVRAGDRPRPNSDVLGVTVLLAGVTDLPRLDELEARTRDYLDGTLESHDSNLSAE